jgi:hypothetical protein
MMRPGGIRGFLGILFAMQEAFHLNVQAQWWSVVESYEAAKYQMTYKNAWPRAPSACKNGGRE